MKKRAICAVFACALALVSINSWAALPIEHWTQPSGVRVYLVQTPGIPMVDVQIDFDAGSRRDPADKTGLANIMAQSTSNGVRALGALPALDENGLSEAWADLGASFSGSASADRMTFALRTLTYADVLGKAARLAGRQLGQPSFPSSLWLRDRPKLIASLKEADTRPATLAARAFGKAVYGEHPYGREVNPNSLNRIRVQDMQALHAKVIRPCYAQVSIVGAVDRPQADALVTQIFAHLPASTCQPMPAVPEVQPLQSAQELRIAFASAQAHVLVGQPGFKRNDPDFFALFVGNHVLGAGGFTSRLTEEVSIGLQTRPDQAEQALQVVRDVVNTFVMQGPTSAELQAAKDNLIGGFSLRIDSNRKLVGNVANIAWNGLPLNYLDTWTQQVQNVSVEDIRAAFGRKLQPKTMVTVVLGAVAPASMASQPKPAAP
jgi:zinc protease